MATQMKLLHTLSYSLLLAFISIWPVRATTFAGDIEALKQVKGALDASSIQPYACLGSWNFSVDPCDSMNTVYFTCGFTCDVSVASKKLVDSISFDGAGYRGKLSPYIGNMSSLQVLDVSGNALSGLIPESVGRLCNLVKLDLSNNNFSGRIPQSFGNLHNLAYLSLAYNALDSELPSSFNTMISLKRLYVENNKLSGPFPALDNLKQLSYVDGSSNKISGKLPLKFPPNLVQFSLRSNLLEGSLPTGLLGLQYLQVLDLSNNKLGGSIQGDVIALPSLQQINLSYNQFVSVGAINTTGSESDLVAIDLGYNRITGAMPLFTEFKRLSSLSLRYNLLRGPIPQEYAYKAAVPTSESSVPLVRLYLDGNYLSGDVPSLFLNVPRDRLTGSFAYNCLRSCPQKLSVCNGNQRPRSQCRRMLYEFSNSGTGRRMMYEESGLEA